MPLPQAKFGLRALIGAVAFLGLLFGGMRCFQEWDIHRDDRVQVMLPDGSVRRVAAGETARRLFGRSVNSERLVRLVEARYAAVQDKRGNSEHDPSEDELKAIYAARLLGGAQHPRALDLLVGLLDDPFIGIRYEAAFDLGELGDRRAVPHLRARLRHATESTERSELAYALGRLGDVNAAVPVLIDTMGDHWPEPRLETIEQITGLSLADIRTEWVKDYKCHRQPDEFKQALREWWEQHNRRLSDSVETGSSRSMVQYFSRRPEREQARPSRKANAEPVPRLQRRIDLAINVTNPARTLVPGEPLSLLVEGFTKDDPATSDHEFVIEIRAPGARYVVNLDDCGLNPQERLEAAFVAKPDGGWSTRFYSVVWLGTSRTQNDGSGDDGVVTALTGEYVVRIKDITSGNESQPVQFQVRTVPSADAAAAEIFTSQAGRECFFFDPSRGLSPIAYEEILVKHPNTRFDAYASLIVGRARMEILERRMLDRPEFAAESAVLAPYLEKTLRLGFRSLFELEALLLKDRCLAATADLETRRTLLTELVSKYGGVTGRPELDEAKQLLADIDQMPALIQRLNDADQETRRTATDRVAKLGPIARDAIPALLDLVARGDPADAENALEEIVLVQRTPVLELTDALKNGDPLVRRLTAWRLRENLEDAEVAVPALNDAVANDADAFVRTLAAQSLGRFGRKAKVAVPILNAAMQGKDQLLRRNAIAALARIVALDGDQPVAVRVLIEALKDPDRAVRWDAIAILGWIGPRASSAVPALTEILKEDNDIIHIDVAGALGRIGVASPPTIEALLECLKHDHPQNARLTAALALFKLAPQNADAGAALASALRAPEATVRNNAFLEVGRLGPRTAVPLFRDVLTDADPSIRLDAVRHLGRLGPDARAAIPALIQTLREGSATVRMAAAQAVMQTDPSNLDAIPTVAALLRHEDEPVRRNAAATLRAIGPPAQTAVPALIHALSDDYETVMEQAAFALRAIGPAAKPAVPVLVSFMRSGRNKYIRICAAGALAKLDPDSTEAVPVLIAGLKDPYTVVRPTAADCLAEIGPDAAVAVPALTEALKDPYPHGQVRYHAARALGKIGPAARSGLPALREALKDPEPHVRQESAKAMDLIQDQQ